MRYFRLFDNVYYPKRWYLGDVIPDDDNWKYIYGIKVDETLINQQLKVKIYQTGQPMDYTMTGGYLIPIVSETLKETLSFVNDLQFIPVDINGVQFYIMVICSIVDCVDELNSDFDRFTEDDHVSADRIGNYKTFYKMKIDKDKMGTKDICRVGGFIFEIIISEKVKTAIENVNPLTADFTEV